MKKYGIILAVVTIVMAGCQKGEPKKGEPKKEKQLLDPDARMAIYAGRIQPDTRGKVLGNVLTTDRDRARRIVFGSGGMETNYFADHLDYGLYLRSSDGFITRDYSGRDTVNMRFLFWGINVIIGSPEKPKLGDMVSRTVNVRIIGSLEVDYPRYIKSRYSIFDSLEARGFDMDWFKLSKDTATSGNGRFRYPYLSHRYRDNIERAAAYPPYGEYMKMDSLYGHTVDIVAYIPNDTMWAIRQRVKAAFEKGDYETCYRIFDNDFVAIPTTAREYDALIASGEEKLLKKTTDCKHWLETGEVRDRQ